MNIYRMIAYKDGREVILAEYRGDDTGLYGFKVVRRDSYGEEDMPYGRKKDWRDNR